MLNETSRDSGHVHAGGALLSQVHWHKHFESADFFLIRANAFLELPADTNGSFLWQLTDRCREYSPNVAKRPSTLVYEPSPSNSDPAHGSDGPVLLICLRRKFAEFHAEIAPATRISLGQEAIRLAAAALNECLHEDRLSAHAVNALLIELLICARRACAASQLTGDDPWLAKIVDFLTDRYRENLSLAQIAKKFGMAEHVIARGFRKAFGTTVAEYTRNLRLERACSLLLTSNLSISAIAAESGFSDQSHLCRLFLRWAGTSPAKFRRVGRGCDTSLAAPNKNRSAAPDNLTGQGIAS